MFLSSPAEFSWHDKCFKAIPVSFHLSHCFPLPGGFLSSSQLPHPFLSHPECSVVPGDEVCSPGITLARGQSWSCLPCEGLQGEDVRCLWATTPPTSYHHLTLVNPTPMKSSGCGHIIHPDKPWVLTVEIRGCSLRGSWLPGQSPSCEEHMGAIQSYQAVTNSVVRQLRLLSGVQPGGSIP